jgi:hypothetical protein
LWLHACPIAGASPFLTLSGTVYDSIARAPLTGANVQAALAEAVPRVFTARSDSAAHFHIYGLPSGRLDVVFQHGALNVLGLESLLRAVAIALDSSATVNLYIPSGATVTARRCSGRPLAPAG